MGKRSILFMAGLLVSFGLYAQGDRAPTGTPRQPLAYTEQKPEPTFSVQDYLAKNLHYPELAKKNEIEGQVLVKFIINAKGETEQASVVKGIGSGCDEEAVRLIKNMPPWVPGRQQGNAVAFSYTLPVNFELEETDGSPKSKISIGWDNGFRLKIHFSF